MLSIFKSAPKPDHRATAEQKLRNLVALHLKTLAIKRTAGLTVDDYGKVDGSKWMAEAQYFVDKLFAPLLSVEEKQAIFNAGLSAVAQELIELPVRAECRRMRVSGEHDMTVRALHPPDLEPRSTAGFRRDPLAKEVRSTGSASRGLIIREDPLEGILSGRKTWEMRSAHTKIRGTVALVQKGSKAIFGVADIVDSRGPFSRAEMLEAVRFHAIAPERLDSPEISAYRYAWVLQNVRRLPRPIRYQHKGGVIFVTLDEVAVSELKQFIGKAPGGV